MVIQTWSSKFDPGEISLTATRRFTLHLAYSQIGLNIHRSCQMPLIERPSYLLNWRLSTIQPIISQGGITLDLTVIGGPVVTYSCSREGIRETKSFIRHSRGLLRKLVPVLARYQAESWYCQQQLSLLFDIAFYYVRTQQHVSTQAFLTFYYVCRRPHGIRPMDDICYWPVLIVSSTASFGD